MTNNLIQVAVVGSGPTGLSAVRSLIAHQKASRLNVVVIQPIDLDVNEGSSDLVRVARRFKPQFDSWSAYDQGNYLKMKLGYGASILPSKVAGGFSNVWGASIGDTVSTEQFTPFVFDASEALDQIFPLSDSLNTNSGGVNTQKVAINFEKCNLCGECLRGCKNNAIWSSKDPFERMYLNRSFEKRDEFVDKIAFSKGKPELFYASGKSEVFDYVFLCCGPVGTVSLLLKSNLVASPVRLRETRMYFLLSIRTPKQFQKNSFALATRFLKDSAGSFPFYLQVYDDPRGLWYRLPSLEKLFRKKSVFDFLCKALSISILYLDSESSPQLELSIRDLGLIFIRKIRVSTGKQALFRTLIRIIRKFRYLSSFPIFVVPGKTGESFHVGSIFGNSDAENLRRGKVLGQKILVCDATTLNQIEPGPITPLAMKNASNVILGFYERLP